MSLMFAFASGGFVVAALTMEPIWAIHAAICAGVMALAKTWEVDRHD